MKVTISFVPKSKPKVRKVLKSRGFRVAGHKIWVKDILTSKYLTKAERNALMDMCYGMTIKKGKTVKRVQKNPRPIAKYGVYGTIFCDGSIEELSEFYGV